MSDVDAIRKGISKKYGNRINNKEDFNFYFEKFMGNSSNSNWNDGSLKSEVWQEYSQHKDFTEKIHITQNEKTGKVSAKNRDREFTNVGTQKGKIVFVRKTKDTDKRAQEHYRAKNGRFSRVSEK